MNAYRVHLRASEGHETVVHADSPEEAVEKAVKMTCVPALKWRGDWVERDDSKDDEHAWDVVGACEQCSKLLLDGRTEWVEDENGVRVCREHVPAELLDGQDVGEDEDYYARGDV